jgi:hypothetical protein
MPTMQRFAQLFIAVMIALIVLPIRCSAASIYNPTPNGQVLYEINQPMRHTGSGSPLYNSFTPYFSVHEHGIERAAIFSWLTFTKNDVGRTFRANALNDPQFNAFVNYLTDSREQVVFVPEDAGGSQGGNESEMLPGFDVLPGQITQITYTVTGWEIAPGTWPGGGVIYNRYFGYRITFESGTPVPEPGSLAYTVTIGLVGIFAMLYRRATSRYVNSSIAVLR